MLTVRSSTVSPIETPWSAIVVAPRAISSTEVGARPAVITGPIVVSTPSIGPNAWNHVTWSPITASVPMIAAAASTSGLVPINSATARSSSGFPIAVLADKSHGAPNCSGDPASASRLAVRPMAVSAVPTASAMPPSAVPVGNPPAPRPLTLMLTPAIAGAGRCDRTAPSPARRADDARWEDRRNWCTTGHHVAAMTTTTIATAPTARTGPSIDDAGSISAWPATPNGPSAESPIAAAMATSAAIAPVTAPRSSAASPASRSDIPMARSVEPSAHSRRLWRDTA